MIIISCKLIKNICSDNNNNATNINIYETYYIRLKIITFILHV